MPDTETGDRAGTGDYESALAIAASLGQQVELRRRFRLRVTKLITPLFAYGP